MSQIEHLKKLINIKNRRLQKLKETQALYGPTIDPKTIIEIEDLEEEIKNLQEELQNAERDTSPTTSILASLPIPPAFAHAQVSEIYWADRKNELKALAEIWESKQVKVVGLIGWGGVGKSTLARRWYDELYKLERPPDGFFWWSFYYQPSLDEFLNAVLAYLTENKFHSSETPSPWVRIQQFVSLLGAGRFVIVLDGLEVMQKAQDMANEFGRLEDRAFRNLLELCADTTRHNSLILITSRFSVTDLQSLEGLTYKKLQVDYFSTLDGAEYLKRREIAGDLSELKRLSNEYGGHALSLSLLAGYLNEYFDGNSQYAREIPFLATSETTKVNQILSAYNNRLGQPQKAFMQLLSAFRRPITHQTLEAFVYNKEFSETNPLLKTLSSLGSFDLRNLIKNLEKRGLVSREQNYLGEWCYTTHLIIREYFYQQLTLEPDLKRRLYLQLRDFSSSLPIPEHPKQLEDLTPLFDVVFYSCGTGLFDEAAEVYYKYLGHWKLLFQFGVYEFHVSFLREFFPDRDLNKNPQVSNPSTECFLLNAIAYSLEKLGQLSEALRLHERAAYVAVGASDNINAAIAYQGIAKIQHLTGKLSDAQETTYQGVELAKKSNSTLWKGNLFASFGWTFFLRGQVLSAEQAYDAANSQRLSDDPEERGIFSILGVQYATFLLATGRTNDSRKNTERNLRRCEKRNWPESIAYCKRLLGDIAIVENDLGKASQLYRESMKIARNFGMQEQTAYILLGMAKISMANGKFDEALVNLESALEIARQFGYIIQEIEIRNSLADLNIAQGNLAEAREQAHQTLKFATDTQFLWGQSTALHLLGHIALLSNNQTEAHRLLEEAFKIRKHIQDPQIQITQELMNQLEL